MQRIALTIAVIVCLAPTARSDELKTTRIALFSSGVGYFESSMTVNGAATAELKFRAEQVNDVLKSLVLRDLDGGTISAVEYPSRDPVEKALRSFAVDITARPTLGELLDQLRGVPVEVQAPNPIKGAVLGVEKQTFITDEKTTIKRDVLTILTDDGLRSFVLAEVAGVKILDAKVEGELRKALETLAASHDSDKKTVVLNFAGEGQRRVRAGYVLEMPIWKTSYRLELAEGKKPYLQGWAIVENATEQDWENVRLSLVSGRPISFVMDLYQPLYIHRPLEQLALYESLRPPTYEGAMLELAKKPEAPAEKLAEGKSKGDRPARARAPASPAPTGEPRGKEAGMGGGRFKDAGMAKAEDEERFDLDDAGVASVAAAQTAGELFEYAIQTPVTIKRQHSAMLPIAAGEVEGTKLSIFNPQTHPKHPLNGLRLKNASGLHLMQGPITVFDGGVYAGDSKLPDVRRDEERLISYALDLAVEVDVKQQPAPDEVTQVWIAKGQFWQRRRLLDQREYTLRNKDAGPRTVLVEHAIGPEWQLVEPKTVEERTGSLVRLKADLPGRQAQTLVVKAERPLDEAVALTNLNADQVAFFVQGKTISDAVKQALAEVLKRRQELDRTRGEIERTKGEIKAIEEDQQRIRQNMQSLSQTSEVYRRYEKKFDTQETQIEEQRGRLAELQKQEQAQRKALEDYVESLAVN
jgi:hypothetical protein